MVDECDECGAALSDEGEAFQSLADLLDDRDGEGLAVVFCHIFRGNVDAARQACDLLALGADANGAMYAIMQRGKRMAARFPA